MSWRFTTADLPLLRLKFMNTFRFCPLTLAGAVCYSLQNYRGRQAHGEPCMLICCSMDQPARQPGGGRAGEAEAQEAAPGLTSGQEDRTIVLVPW